MRAYVRVRQLSEAEYRELKHSRAFPEDDRRQGGFVFDALQLATGDVLTET